MKKRSVLIILLSLLLVPVLGVCFFLFSSMGLVVGVELAGKMLPGELVVENIRGRLVDEISLEGLRYKDKESEVNLKHLTLSWNAFALVDKALQLKMITINDLQVQTSRSNSSGTKVPENDSPLFFLPMSVTIEKASIHNISITIQGDPPIQFNEINLEKGQAEGSLIKFLHLGIRAPSYAFSGAGRIETGETLLTELTINYSFSPEGYGDIAGKAVLKGSLEKMHADIQMQSPFEGYLKGTVTDLADKPKWQAELKTQEVSLVDINNSWPEFVLTNLQAEGKGSLEEYSVRTGADVDYGDFTNVHVQTTITGDLNGLRFDDTVLTRQDGELSGQGRVAWQDSFTWEATTSGSNIVLADIQSGWPDIHLLDIAIKGKGEHDRYSLNVQAGAEYEDFKDFQVVADIAGDSEGLRLPSVLIRHSAGELSGKILLDWRNEFAWHADITVKDINPEAVFHKLPGNLEAQIVTNGNLADGIVNCELDLVALKGNLQGYPFSALGKVTLDGDVLSINNFFLKTKGTEITASGFVNEKVDLHFDVESTDLSVVWPDIGGKVKAEGSFKGERIHPVVQARITGENISAYGNRVESIDGTINTDLSPDGIISAVFNATGLILEDKSIDTVAVDLEGKVGKHSLKIDVSGDDGLVSLKVTGGMDEEKNWNGVLNGLELQADRIGTWRLKEPGEMKISVDNFEIDQFCLDGPEASGLCFTGAKQAESWEVKTDLQHIPISLVTQFTKLNENTPLRGTLSGEASFAGSNSEPERVEILLSADDASIQLNLSDDVKHELLFQANKIHAVLAENRLSADIMSVLRDKSKLDATLVVDNFSPFAHNLEQIKLHGALHLQIMELTPLIVFTFPYFEPQGSLSGNFAIGGTVAHPFIDGQLASADGKLIVPQLGITLDGFDMQVKGEEQLLKFIMTGNSGGGYAKAEGDMAIETGKPISLDLAVSGDSFEVVNLPEIRLAVSPQLKMNLSRENGQMSGTLRLTEGLIAPLTLSETVSPSKDVEFVSGEKGEVAEKWPFSATLSVIVDNKVKVDAFGLRGNVEGKVDVVDLPGKIPTGNGNLAIQEGTFTYQGRELDIKTGQLLFSGGPIDNPGISVRAESKTKDVIAGIEVSGFLRQPELDFYSDPPMEKNEIISRILTNTSLISSSEKEPGLLDSIETGTPIDPLLSTISSVSKTLRIDDVRVESGKASDDMSLVIGSWLTPELYISYGKNLLKESGSFQTKYILGHGFSFETETGSTASGADMKFEIDN